jgi:peptidoglycan/xylan/chitin deacetylase (PgdA/CDA1 family)
VSDGGCLVRSDLLSKKASSSAEGGVHCEAMVKSPWIFRKLFSNLIWKILTREKILYLTFDDGPHPVATPFVLEQLRQFNAKATFFCVGKNVAAYPSIYEDILNAGHAVGNHTQNHMNGWKADNQKYFVDILEAQKYIDSTLFRPPYGRITPFQSKYLRKPPFNFTIIMWDVLSKDYDLELSPDDATLNVLRYASEGSIVVFHDSEKAFPRMQKALTATLRYFSEKGWTFKAIDEK